MPPKRRTKTNVTTTAVKRTRRPRQTAINTQDEPVQQQTTAPIEGTQAHPVSLDTPIKDGYLLPPSHQAPAPPQGPSRHMPPLEQAQRMSQLEQEELLEASRQQLLQLDALLAEHPTDDEGNEDDDDAPDVHHDEQNGSDEDDDGGDEDHEDHEDIEAVRISANGAIGENDQDDEDDDDDKGGNKKEYPYIEDSRTRSQRFYKRRKALINKVGELGAITGAYAYLYIRSQEISNAGDLSKFLYVTSNIYDTPNLLSLCQRHAQEFREAEIREKRLDAKRSKENDKKVRRLQKENMESRDMNKQLTSEVTKLREVVEKQAKRLARLRADLDTDTSFGGGLSGS